MVERLQNGRENKKRDRNSERRFTGEAQRTHEHKFPKKQILSKTSYLFSFTTVRFIEIEGVEVTVRLCVATIFFSVDGLTYFGVC